MTGTANNTPTTDSCYLVRIELKRVQTYLFEVPRLSVMVGANALMGETLRGVWTGEKFLDKVPLPGREPLDVRSLPWLAQECQAELPSGAKCQFRALIATDEDPLKTRDGTYQDDVQQVAERTGVLTRDGGHFEAVFAGGDAGKQRAEEFIRRARELLHERIPGAALDIKLQELTPRGDGYELDEANVLHLPASGASLLAVTQAHVCEYSGNEPASECVQEDAGVDAETRLVSASVAGRLKKGREFDAGQTRDVLGLLRPQILRDLGFQDGQHGAFPVDFNELSRSGYMAVIHLDGNSVGGRYTAYKNAPDNTAADKNDFFAQWNRREQFFHTARAGVRIAVLEAIPAVFKDQRTRNGNVPLRLLMLGGDDLVAVCEASLAMRLVIELAKAITTHTAAMPDGKGPLTIGAGIAIVQSSFPFHRAYELADQLASSAKRLKACLPAVADPREGNVVDWVVSSEAWHGDIEATRRTDTLVDDLVLSSKPYRILDVGGGPGAKPDRPVSLERMWADAERLVKATQENRIGRNQLQGLIRSLRQGRHTATFAAAVLPLELRDLLKTMGYLDDSRNPWTPAKTSAGQDCFLTRLIDLLELYELQVLQEIVSQGRRRPPRKTTKKKSARPELMKGQP